ncbi:MAG: helix-turn-helix domain-containing protein [Terriglobales bacterium]
MEKQDARSLPGEAQEDLRRRVVEAVQKGLSQTKAAGVFGVARGTVSRWMGLVERAGRRALKAQRRGRPPVSRLAPHQAATTVRHILSGCPDQLNLPFALWTREAVQQLLSRKLDLQVSVWTVGRYLRAWGLTNRKTDKAGDIAGLLADGQGLHETGLRIDHRARQQFRLFFIADMRAQFREFL